MIEIRLEDASFEQDIRPLVRAFFSREDMKVIICDFEEPEKVDVTVSNFVLSVHNDEKLIEMWFKDDAKRKNMSIAKLKRIEDYIKTN